MLKGILVRQLRLGIYSSAVLVLLVFSTSLYLTGCQSSRKPASARFASVTVRGNTPGQIASVIRETFTEHGYSAASTEPGNLVFEKKAKAFGNIAYGNWEDDAPLFLRVKVRIVPVGEEETFRVECQAYNVRDRGSPTEEEIRFSNLRSHPFHQLLDEVAARLRPKGTS